MKIQEADVTVRLGIKEDSMRGLLTKEWARALTLTSMMKDPRVSNGTMSFPHLCVKGSREGAVMEPGESCSKGEGHLEGAVNLCRGVQP